MDKLAGYITLDSVVLDFLDEAQLSQHQYSRLWNIAFRGLEDLGMDFFYQVRTVALPVAGNLTAVIPPDFLQWTKVGVLNSRGEVIPLYYNDKMTSYADLRDDRADLTTDNSLSDLQNWGVNTWMNYWDGQRFTNIYGVPSGSPVVGSFKIDRDNGVIVLDQNFSYPYVMLEYTAAPVEGEDYHLPVQFREALLSWLLWKSNRSLPANTHVRRQSIGEYKHDYYNDRRNAIAKYKPLREQEMLQASQEMTRLAVKT